MSTSGKRVALVTGSGKKRVGWHVANALARRGFNIAVHYRDSAKEAAETVQYLRGRDVVDTGSNTIRDSLALVEDGEIAGVDLPAGPFGIVSLHRYELLNDRYLHERPTVITSNRTPEHLEERLRDRVSGMAVEIHLVAASYRQIRRRDH